MVFLVSIKSYRIFAECFETINCCRWENEPKRSYTDHLFQHYNVYGPCGVLLLYPRLLWPGNNPYFPNGFVILSCFVQGLPGLTIRVVARFCLLFFRKMISLFCCRITYKYSA